MSESAIAITGGPLVGQVSKRVNPEGERFEAICWVTS